MPLFRDTFFLEKAEISASVFRICLELWVLIEEHVESWVLFWKNMVISAMKGKGYAKVAR